MQNIYCVQSFCGLIRPEPFHTGSSLCYIIYSTQPYWLSDALCHIRQAQAVFLPNVRTIIDNFHTVLINGDIMSDSISTDCTACRVVTMCSSGREPEVTSRKHLTTRGFSQTRTGSLFCKSLLHGKQCLQLAGYLVLVLGN